MTATLDPDQGVRGDGGMCALAQVIMQFGNVRSVSVEGEHPSITTCDGQTVSLSVDAGIAEWIGKFDRGEPVEPLSIDIYV